MDKRKLSAIPREEATADMIEIAEMLGVEKHMVTAQLIEDNKILLLNFYEVSKLKKGKTAAVFRTFLSEDDYITQDLKQSKVKWLTSTLYNMDNFSLSNFHWDKKKEEYTHIPLVRIRTCEERDLIGGFFKKYDKEKTKYHWDGCYPYPWEAVRNFQDAVLARKLKERHAKELQATDIAMAPFENAPPKEFFDWVWETGMSFSRYVVYKEVSKGKAECECTYCGKVDIVDRKEIRLRDNEKGVCPFCESKVTFKAKGRFASQTQDERWFIYVDPTRDGFALRYFHCYRIHKNDTGVLSSVKRTRHDDFSHEMSRKVYSFSDSGIRDEAYEWDVYKQRGPLRWCPSKEKYPRSEAILYPGNLPEAWAHTPLKYSAFEVLAANLPTTGINYENGMLHYFAFPKLEWFCKMGLNQLAKHIMGSHRYLTSGSAQGNIKFSGETIYEILGLTKVNTRLMQEIDGCSEELRLLQVAQKMGYQFKPEQLRAYYNMFGCNTDLLKESNRKVSLHKLVKYIAKESERYPKGDKGSFCRYSMWRYKEREDPRVERMQNTAGDWLEYLKWCKALKYDLDNMFIYMPKNFKAVHDRTAQEYQALQDKKAAAEKAKRERAAKRMMVKTQKAMEEIFANSEGTDAFSIKGKGLILIVPKSGDEIRDEGAKLHHCVGGYVERVAKGETNIFFIRKATEPDKPYYTMEWRDNRVIQCRGSHNCDMTAEVKAFTQVFAKKMLESINNTKEAKKSGRKKQNLQSA